MRREELCNASMDRCQTLSTLLLFFSPLCRRKRNALTPSPSSTHLPAGSLGADTWGPMAQMEPWTDGQNGEVGALPALLRCFQLPPGVLLVSGHTARRPGGQPVLGPVSPPTHVAALPSPHPVSSVVALAPRRRREGSHACCCPECPLCASPHYSELPRLAGRLCRKGGSMRPRPAEHEHMVKDVVIGHGHALYARHACPTGTTGEGRREDPTHLAVLDRPAVSGKINGSRQAWWCWRSLHAPLFLLRLPWLLLAASEPASLP